MSPYTTYRLAQWLAPRLWKTMGGQLQVHGTGAIPRTGPFILVANHQSLLDPILIQSVCPRVLHTMAKSTQFASQPMRWLMIQLQSFPVRRFQIDPQSVRTPLRLLSQGIPVGIYIEGERSWDGNLQEARRGTIRLILKAGVPVVPCGITGSYDAWPRWDSRPKRSRIDIRFGQPIELPKLDRRDEREAVLDATAKVLMEAVRSQMAANCVAAEGYDTSLEGQDVARGEN